jgi:hypothetical protein
LDLPPSFEVYDQKSQAKFLKDGTSFKEFEVLLIPREPGVFKINPVQLAVFDPQSHKFENISTQALDLTVTGTGAGPTSAVPGVQNPTSSNGTSPAPQAQGPQLPGPATELGSAPVSRSLLWKITAALGLLALGSLFFAHRRFVRRKPKRVSLQLVLTNRMKKVRELVGKKEWRKVGVELTNTGYFILNRVVEPGRASQELEGLLESTPPSLRKELAKPIRDVLSQCEALSFAPEHLISEMTEATRLDKLIKEFEKVFTRVIELADF